MMMFVYSAMKKSAHRKPEYSTWKPATSSDSLSGRSNGARFVSASARDEIDHESDRLDEHEPDAV